MHTGLSIVILSRCLYCSPNQSNSLSVGNKSSEILKYASFQESGNKAIKFSRLSNELTTGIVSIITYTDSDSHPHAAVLVQKPIKTDFLSYLLHINGNEIPSALVRKQARSILNIYLIIKPLMLFRKTKYCILPMVKS